MSTSQQMWYSSVWPFEVILTMASLLEKGKINKQFVYNLKSLSCLPSKNEKDSDRP